MIFIIFIINILFLLQIITNHHHTLTWQLECFWLVSISHQSIPHNFILVYHLTLSFHKVFFIIPCVDIFEKIDMRTATYEIPPQEVGFNYFALRMMTMMTMIMMIEVRTATYETPPQMALNSNLCNIASSIKLYCSWFLTVRQALDTYIQSISFTCCFSTRMNILRYETYFLIRNHFRSWPKTAWQCSSMP